MRPFVSVAILLGTLSSSVSALADPVAAALEGHAQPGEPEDLGERAEQPTPVNRALLVTGFALFGGSYAASAVDAALSTHPADQNNLYLPLVGPWLDYGDRAAFAGSSPHATGANEGVARALLIADGAVQGLGVVSLVASAFVPEKATRRWILLGNDEVRATPMAVGSGYGIGARGRF